MTAAVPECLIFRPRAGIRTWAVTLPLTACVCPDLVLLSANPLEDIGVLADPSKFVAVFKGGIPVCRRPDFGTAKQ